VLSWEGEERVVALAYAACWGCTEFDLLVGADLPALRMHYWVLHDGYISVGRSGVCVEEFWVKL